MTIFYTTHVLSEAEYLCDNIAIINKGKILAVDSPNELKNRFGSEKTIKINPNSAEAHFNLGILYESLDQGEKAIVHILKAGNLFGEKNDSVNKMESRKLLKEFYKKFGFKPEDMKTE